MRSQWISLISSKFTSNNVFSLQLALWDLVCKHWKNNNGQNFMLTNMYIKIRRGNTFRTWFCHRIHVFPMIITVSRLLSLIQLIKRFKLHVLTTRKLTLFSWRKIDWTTRISVKVRINHCFSMNFTHFFEVYLQLCFFHCNWPYGPKYRNWINKTTQSSHGETKSIMLNSA